jgi:hypothetical protein
LRRSDSGVTSVVGICKVLIVWKGLF